MQQGAVFLGEMALDSVNTQNQVRSLMLVLLRLPLLRFALLVTPVFSMAQSAAVTLADLERACERGDGSACVDVGYNLEPSDPAKAVAVYRSACAKNVLAACSNLALMLRDARGAPKNLVEAAQVAKKACDGGNAPGCLHLGLVKDAANDFSGATAAYDSACKAQVLAGCTNFAINQLKGVGTKPNVAGAAALLEKTCAESVKTSARNPSLRSCLLLGQLYEQGRGLPHNTEAAKRLFRLACFSGLDEACARQQGSRDEHQHP